MHRIVVVRGRGLMVMVMVIEDGLSSDDKNEMVIFVSVSYVNVHKRRLTMDIAVVVASCKEGTVTTGEK
jgi:hypothetical protein